MVAVEGRGMSAPRFRDWTMVAAAGVIAGAFAFDCGVLAAQGIQAGLGGGVGILEWQGATAIQPALQLSVGYQAQRSLAIRLDGRMVGTTNSALFGPGFGLGFSGPLGRLPSAHVLATAGTLLASEGTWVSSVGAVAGVGGAGPAALFGEARLEFLSGDRTRAQRGSAVASIVAGFRIGSRRR